MRPAALALAGILAAATPASAQSVVTLCAQDNQAGAGTNLDAALAAGGGIAFNCPAGSAILITSQKLVTVPTRINGMNRGQAIRLVNAIPFAAPAIPVMIQVMPAGSLEVADVEFSGSSVGGALLSQGTLRVIGSGFTGFYDAVDVSRGDATIVNSRFEGNNLSVSVSLTAQRLRVTGGSFQGNSRGVAGAAGLPAIAVPPGRSYVVDRSIFADNVIAVQHCSGDDCPQPFDLVQANSLIVNSRPGNAAVRGRAIRLVNTTVAGNRGSGIAAEPGGSVVLANSIVSGNAGGNCAGSIAQQGPSLQFPGSSCGASVTSSDPGLSSLWEPADGGPAQGTADTARCASAPVNKIDYYAKPRLESGACSIGAVEKPLERPPVLPRSRDRDRDRQARERNR